MDARLTEFVSAGEAPGSTLGAHATRHAWNSAPWRGGGPHGITWPRQRGGWQPGRREQPSPVAMFPPGVGRIPLPSQIPSATAGDGQRSALLGGRAASSHVPAATNGDGQRSARMGGRAAPDCVDELNAKRIPGVGARLRGAPRRCPLLLGGRKRGCSRSAGHARDTDSRAHGGGITGGIRRRERRPWRLRSKRPRSARKRPRSQRASC